MYHPVVSKNSDARRSARNDWPVVVTRLGDEAAMPTAWEDRLAMMWELVVQSWGIAGKQMPHYERANMPVRVIRGEEAAGR